MSVSFYQLAAVLAVLCMAPAMGRLTGGVQCIDDSGHAVDWWFIYKMPNGFQYAYYDAKSTNGKLSLASDTLDCTTGCALGDTLHQLYTGKTTLAHVIYNDEPEGDKLGKDTTSGPNGGHVKGVMAADKNGGFWLIHSVPLFPDLGPPSFTWTASTIYGQSFLCVSLDEDGIEQAATELQFMDPNIYSSAIPSSLQSTFPQMTALYNGKRQVGQSVVSITSSGGTKFTHFAKDNTWGKDLYDDLVAPTLKLDFQWETWRRAPFLPSVCSTYDTLNVASISLGTQQFSYTQDHSKWGVSVKGSYACIGGINRMQSQRNRGGGTMCLSDADFWKALTGVIASSEPCGKGPKAVSDTEHEKPKSKSKPKAKPKPKKTRSPAPVRGSQGVTEDDFAEIKQATPVTSGPAPRHHGAPHAHSKHHHSNQVPHGPRHHPHHHHEGGAAPVSDDESKPQPPTNHPLRHGSRTGKPGQASNDGGGRLPMKKDPNPNPNTDPFFPTPLPTKVSTEIHAPEPSG